MTVIAVTVLMIVTAFFLRGKWKWLLSPILIIVAITVFVIPNISYFMAPVAYPFKVVVTENGNPVEGVNIITARGLEFTSFLAHIPEVTWRDVDVKATNYNGEVNFDKKLRFMTINLGIIGNWHDNNDIFYSCVKNGYRYVSAITSTKSTIFVNIDKNIKGSEYYSGLRLLELDKKYILVDFSRKAKKLIDLYSVK